MIKVLNMNRRASSTWKRATLFFVSMMFVSVFAALGQNIQVKGVVTDGDNNEPIPGVNISIEGTTQGVITDFDGKYVISAPKNATLVFSFIGYIAQKQPVQGRAEINVKLASDSKQLDEVVAIGYGSSKKKDLTGSVSSISAKDIANIPVTSPAQALAGRAAGVQITTADGSPDAEVLIRVRGGGSVTGDNSPLYIVDGFPVKSISDISPADIKTYDILKDASSAAIYGSQGANGVIIITTKSAEGGKTKVSYQGFMQAKQLAKHLDVLDPYEYVMLNYELNALDGATGISTAEKKFGVYEDYDLYKYQKGTDWQKDMFGATTISKQHNLTITGGTDKTKFALSNTYNKDGGLMVGNDYSRFNSNLKLSHEIAKNLRFNANIRVQDVLINGSGTSGGTYKIRTTAAVTRGPVNGLEDFQTVDVSSMDEDEYQAYVNSHMSLSQQAQEYWKKQKRRTFNFTSSIDWDIVKGLTYRIEGGYEYGFNETQNYWGATTTNASYVNGLPLADWTKQNSSTVRGAQTLTYKKTFGEVHKVDGMIGQELISNKVDRNYMYGTGYSKDMTPEKIFANFANFDARYGSTTASSYVEPDDNLTSFFGRAGYTFNERYLASFTLRADGSSKFPAGNQWGLFPSAALAWRISEEPFMVGTKDWLSNLKMRVSYGEAGNNRIKSALYKLQYSINTTKTYGQGDIQNNYYATTNTQLANPNLKWETTVTRNVGLDFGFLNERLTGTFDLYKNTSSDLLIEHKIVAPGYTSTVENIGATSNKGVEFSLNANAVEKAQFTLAFNFNISFNKSNVDRLADGVTQQEYASGWAGTDLKGTYDYLVKVGEPVGLIYGWVTDGYYTTDDFSEYNTTTKKYVLKDGEPTTGLLGGKIGVRPGTIKLKDLNEDGVIDENDRKVIGKTAPEFTGGFGVNATYHGFDAQLLFNFVYGNDIYNANKIASSQQYRSSDPNMLAFMSGDNRYSYLDRASGEIVTDLESLKQMNEVGSNKKEYWSPFSFGNAVALPHSWAVEDGSYLRLQNVTVGYTIPKKITQKVHCDNLRLYCTLNNLWVLTNYSGYDPEVSSAVRNSSTSGLTPGVDYSAYPKSFSYLFGVNVTF